MNLIICENYYEMSIKAATLAAEGIPQDRESLISFPGGDTALGMVETFVTIVNAGLVDISRTRYVSLDEWVGLGTNNRGSCAWFNQTHLLNKLKKPFQETFIINGQAEDISAECGRLNAFIEKYGPLKVSVLGIGLNGHLGFNEDGVDFNLNAHVIPLAAVTKSVSSKYFDRVYELDHGITQGLKQIMAAERLILIANGSQKADILRRALREPVDPSVPASILQRHPNCYVVTDREAAANL
ncbi:MAG: glucosamine-6-phosphate deaminase [Spirochaetaceae bacterium]|jgi:glucosamine-6-phosphate deaminase|nr:glucosamine-6-phosphate deaminase [Spirochaetaceae bacterium]